MVFGLQIGLHKQRKKLYKTAKNGYLDKMGDENLLKGSYWTFRVRTSIIWASPDDGSSA